MVLHLRQSGFVVLGVASALVLSEGLLRCLSSPNPPPLPQVERDDLAGAIVTRRQIDEGIAVAHFSEAGARLTDNPHISGAPTAVIVGDSYVVAIAVADRATMGGQLEVLARSAGIPLNVRQYGWSGASPAQYLLSASQIRARWKSAQVVIPMADNDLDFNALTTASPRVRILPDGNLRIIGASASLLPPPSNHSAIVTLARHRWFDLRARAPRWVREHSSIPETPAALSREAPPDSLELAALPLAVVRALGHAYGDRLSLVYLADVGLTGDDSVTKIERRFLDACRQEAVRCASTRSAMLSARRGGAITRGTSTNTIGNGHLNALGHRVVASVLWSMLRAQLTPVPRADSR